MKKMLCFFLLAIACLSAMMLAQSKSGLSFHLKLLRTINLAKPSGNVDQLIPLPDQGFLIRDSTYNPLQSQAVEIYEPSGNLVRKIGSYGQEPGHYAALKEIAYSTRQNAIWVVDMLGRVSRFDLSGKFLDSMLVQKPGFHPYGIALNEEQGRYYLTGCVALQFYLNHGCKMVHEYEFSTNKYLRSVAENDPDAVKNRYFSIEDYQLAVASSGLYAVDAPMRKFWRIVPGQKTEAFLVSGKALKGDIPQLDPKLPAAEIARGQYLFENIFADDNTVVISASLKGSNKYLLEVLSATGKPIALDVNSPGRLIGKSSHRTLWFGERRGDKFQLAEYSY
ncbi:MAG TPA: 6-bladed beta-propeller [Candidatus Angelobacter sp.]|jgi:hypothetical protein|nr:6-bladed beta-propeller [Candidatus Angelobacter sp.]